MEFFGFRALEFTGQGGRVGDGAAWITHHLLLVLAAYVFGLKVLVCLGSAVGGVTLNCARP